MPNKRSDNMNAIIREALVAKGFRPETPKDIEAMLDAIGGDEFSPDKIQRMLRKIRGEEPIGVTPSHDEQDQIEAIDAKERELVAFYRAKGEAIPPEIQAKLDTMRRRAKEQGEAKDGK